MRSIVLAFLVLLSCVSAVVLAPRETTAPTCVGLSAKSNNGNRKVAIVIDSSGSMDGSDPYNLRLAAGRALTGWLISNAEATGGRKPDLVTVIDFDDVAYLHYPFGLPAW